MSSIVLDTDVASVSLRGRLTDPLRTRLTGETWCLSFVTLGELTKWTVLRSWGPQKLAELADWRRDVVLLPYSERVAIRWGELQAHSDLHLAASGCAQPHMRARSNITKVGRFCR